MNIKVDNCAVIFEDGRKVEFQFPVKQMMQHDKICIILLQLPPNQFMNENVFGLGSDGSIIWQIQRIPETSNKGDYYVGISSVADSIFKIANWNDVVVDVDIHTGKILNTHEGRFT